MATENNFLGRDVSPAYLKRREKRLEIVKRLKEHGESNIYTRRGIPRIILNRIKILKEIDAVEKSNIIKKHIKDLEDADSIIYRMEGLIFDCFIFDMELKGSLEE